MHIATVLGSLRKDSFSKKVLEALIAAAPAGMTFSSVAIEDLPHFNQDLESAVPESVTAARDLVRSADAVLFVTPEYNRSVPGVLKNAVDWLSRPYGQSTLAGKPVGIVSNSPGAIGGFGANHHLRQMLINPGAIAMAQPEAYLSHIGEKFDAEGKSTDPEFTKHLEAFMQAFAAFAQKLK